MARLSILSRVSSHSRAPSLLLAFSCLWPLAASHLSAAVQLPTAVVEETKVHPRNGGAVGYAATFRLAPVHFHTTYRGVTISIVPGRHGLEIKATIANSSGRTVFVQHAPMAKWDVGVLDAMGGRLVKRPDLPPSIRGYNIPLPPGKSVTRTFLLVRLPGLAAPGVFYVYSEAQVLARPLANGRLGIVYFRSPILRLTLRVDGPPAWKVVASAPPRSQPRQAHSTPPPYPRYKIPTAGPIATLSGIAGAVSTGELGTVRKLCYDGHHAIVPFYVAFAAQVIAEKRCTAAVESRFSANPWPRLKPSPLVFSGILSRLNLQSLRIKGDTASVGVLWFHGGKFIPFPSFAYHFRKVHGQWLLDSWATQESAPHPSARSYRLNVENSLREAAVFDGLARDVAAEKFVNLNAFVAAARLRLAAQGHWFMAHAMPRVVKSSAPAPGGRGN